MVCRALCVTDNPRARSRCGLAVVALVALVAGCDELFNLERIPDPPTWGTPRELDRPVMQLAFTFDAYAPTLTAKRIEVTLHHVTVYQAAAP